MVDALTYYSTVTSKWGYPAVNSWSTRLPNDYYVVLETGDERKAPTGQGLADFG